MLTKPTLGYWDIRALGEPILYLLKYAAIQFNDKRYPIGEETSLKDVKSLNKYWDTSIIWVSISRIFPLYQ
jgi:hypothetical protein